MSEQGLLFTGADWNFGTLRSIHDAAEEIALGELGLSVYPNRIEVITAEQMLDAYASNGMPLMYNHWSFGKRFMQHEGLYRKGLQGLAYEIVINSRPCISYLMEENSATMQALVISHAAFGHNHFFKNNRLFQEWTDPSGILDYLEFARGYIARCEERHGRAAVERVLDAAHALSAQGVHHSRSGRPLDLKSEEKRERERREHDESIYNDLWRTVPLSSSKPAAVDPVAERQRRLGLPEESLLYFLEKFGPRLAPWQREILRIVRLISQYFHPQRQTKVMNEGCATWTHYHIMNRLYQQGRIHDGHFLEFLTSHANVLTQPDFDDPRFGGFNPYALGFAVMRDIERICTSPTEEDREWFPDIAGNQDPFGTLRYAWAEFRDESFLLQYLSPKVIRDFRLFRLRDDHARPHLTVDAIHDADGYRQIRRSIASSYEIGRMAPEILVVDVDLGGDRRLMLEHRTQAGHLLAEEDARATLELLASLWGYEVCLAEIDSSNGRILRQHRIGPRH